LTQPLKIVIPMAGLGTRMRPQTWSKPKPLISVAGRAVLDHLLEIFETIPAPQSAEYIFIVSPHLGENQIPAYMAAHFPDVKVHYIVQSEMKGQSHALWLAREHLVGPMLMIYSDTLIETDLSFLASESLDGVAWVKAVPDPRRFGVAEVNSDGLITRLIEKPQGMENNLALVGCYFFKSAESLVSAIQDQMKRDVQLNGEYFLVDAINIMLESGKRFRTQKVNVWLDTGTIEATLETNAYLLAHGRENNARAEKTKILPPVFIHLTARVSDSVIGPNVSIGANCTVTRSRIENSILEDDALVEAAVLTDSIIGRQAKIQGGGIEGKPVKLNVGDGSQVNY